jgi:hypothetical protein
MYVPACVPACVVVSSSVSRVHVCVHVVYLWLSHTQQGDVSVALPRASLPYV